MFPIFVPLKRTALEPFTKFRYHNFQMPNSRQETAIRELLTEAIRNAKSDSEVPIINDDTLLLQTGIDSLGFAVLVARLEISLGYDPFSMSTEAYYPRTFREFVSFYERYAA
jgi:acyl carrier protein